VVFNTSNFQHHYVHFGLKLAFEKSTANAFKNSPYARRRLHAGYNNNSDRQAGCQPAIQPIANRRYLARTVVLPAAVLPMKFV